MTTYIGHDDDRCLERIEAHQRAQDKAQEALRRELRTGLLRERRALLAGMQALLDGAGGTAATTSPVQQLQASVGLVFRS